MTSISFEIPEKRVDPQGEPFFRCKLTEPGFELSVDLEWHPQQGLKPDLAVQKQIVSLRESVLQQLLQTRSLFRTPPILASLQAITPPWGILLHSKKPMEWSNINQWEIAPELKENEATVHIVLSAIEISRSRISPVWTLTIVHLSPEKEGLIDFMFEEPKEDEVKSVVSDEFDEECDETVFQLSNPNEKKRILKAQIRELLHKAADARHAVDDAISRFFQEFDLSDDESDFSDSDTESEN